MAKVKREVVHPNLFMRVNGAMQRIEKGTVLTLDEENANRPSMKNKLKEVESADSVDLTAKTKSKVKAAEKAPLPGAVPSPFKNGDS